MAVVFALRSDNSSFNARYSTGGKTPGMVLQSSALAAPVYETDATAIGGNRINMDNGASVARSLVYNAATLKTARAISVLMRVKLIANGTFGLFALDSAFNWASNRIVFNQTASDWRASVANANGQFGLNNVNLITETPTLSAWLDLFWSWDGNTTTNGFKFYNGATLKSSQTSSQAQASPWDPKIANSLMIGGVPGANNCRMYVNEVVVWDEVIDPTSVALTSGTGSLNGASRAAFVDVASFDGTSSTDPGIANVVSPTGYTINGVSLTGSYTANSTDPGIGNVKINTGYIINGSTLTGTLLSTDPGENKVLYNTEYYINSVAYTGTYGDPGNQVGTVVDLPGILDDLKSTFDSANTTTAARYLSENVTSKVNYIGTVHPIQIPLQSTFYPFVTCYVSKKTPANATIGSTQLQAKRKAEIFIDVVGAIQNTIAIDFTKDKSSRDCMYLMENLELILRSLPTVNGKINWQSVSDVNYYDSPLNEGYIRVGIITLKGIVFY